MSNHTKIDLESQIAANSMSTESMEFDHETLVELYQQGVQKWKDELAQSDKEAEKAAQKHGRALKLQSRRSKTVPWEYVQSALDYLSAFYKKIEDEHMTWVKGEVKHTREMHAYHVFGRQRSLVSSHCTSS